MPDAGREVDRSGFPLLWCESEDVALGDKPYRSAAFTHEADLIGALIHVRVPPALRYPDPH
ncbi:hypothetical protein [Mycobacteroides abscessus]|uniref:hypothetical protein n=1 Tax=Mycobacteroides abscessus TaxID=36809 RepID=UPI0009A75FD0|nr:hypothetical protein [Mycobacteroides abscessus]MBN7374123.1 hypothetical protein [Mycobacteroides abscessus subsp. abscessus]RIR16460.1 hypothetical protein D2E41_26395 [Mycobacteroides abscessus]